ncbi:cytochrome b/b6 domain-containing protein [Arthrobacter sp. NicSoilB8]|uniref:cytochrome b/b6 domain-containing protein n=1 Tax=Arthrobacter sp. NicSoilB8 TaxID=2830998 RepID=UPI001CC469A0|nr:cytochrome b/b6 domain-containing protein [Arthrobacter sp. NicSoilB8]
MAAPAPAARPVAAEKPVRLKAEARLYGSRTVGQWIKLAVLLAVGAVAAAAILVLAARGVTTLPGVPEFLKRYPGEYGLPETAEPGFPWWAQWAHFLNFFLMVLIIRSGYQVRTQQKPPAFWTPKRGGKKISINLWLHQSLDILWLANGVIFVVLLFASGRWMRIVPSSWDVFPNALSALLQYMTLDWPVETGWVNYNSLQQLMYFLVVFIAAPLAAITGVRMSEFWPKNAKTLNRIYPVEAARAIHFPTMLFFVLFILIHVFLVFSTGALRNLNHMFGGTDAVNWVGFWLFAAAIAVTAAGWYAARPLVLAPIAKLFGQVSSR